LLLLLLLLPLPSVVANPSAFLAILLSGVDPIIDDVIPPMVERSLSM
jgi:hypothetical protein